MTYRNQVTQPSLAKMANLLDEGCYFVANSGQAGLAMAAGPGLVATAPFLLVVNNNPVSAPKTIWLDYLNLTNTVAGSAASGLTFLAATAIIDSGNRYSSAGTQLTPVNPNMNSAAASLGLVYAGAPVATAASGNARTVIGQRNVRPAVSGTAATVVGDDIMFNFGGIEGETAGNIVVANPNLIPVACPAIAIGPQQSALIYLYYAAATTPVAAQFAAEFGYWER